MMLSGHPRRAWANLERTEGNSNCQLSCMQAVRGGSQAGHRTEVGAVELQSRVARQPEGILGFEVRSGWGKELWGG